MLYTEEQKKVLKKKFDELNFKCAVCGHDDFTIIDRIFQYEEFQPSSTTTTGNPKVLPIVVLFCDTCGHIEHFSAIKLGVIDVSEKQLKKSAE